MTGLILIMGGLICLALSGFMVYRLMPREGAPPRSEFGETSLALGQFVLMVAGITLVVKGIF